MLDALATHDPSGSRTLVDIGAGIGEFVVSAADAGWTAVGLEPSREAVDFAEAKGRPVLCTTLERYLESGAPSAPHRAAVLTNVLEHVLHPAELLGTIHEMLPTDGMLVIRVPNDFNPLQEMA